MTSPIFDTLTAQRDATPVFDTLTRGLPDPTWPAPTAGPSLPVAAPPTVAAVATVATWPLRAL